MWSPLRTGERSAPPPVIISGEPRYEVEEILKHRKKGRGFQYLIKWKDYPMNERTWEPVRHLLPGAKKILEKYQKDHGIKIRALPVFPARYWDYLIKRYKCKEESQEYSMKKLYIPETAETIEINGDVDSRGGVRSQFQPVTTPSDKITTTSDKRTPNPKGISLIPISTLQRMAEAQDNI